MLSMRTGDSSAWMGLYQGRKHYALCPGGSALAVRRDGKLFSDRCFDPNVPPDVGAGKSIKALIPAASAHQVRNLPEPTIAVAMNFVDIVNVDRFVARARSMSTLAGDQLTTNEGSDRCI